MKTRQFLGWVAMATMVLSTGCSNDEVVNDYSPENAIQFGTYVGRDAESRGEILTTDGLKEQGFGVYASYTGTENYDASKHTMNFMNNTKVTYNGSEWTYSPLKYWPNNDGDKVSFFAYAPWTEAGYSLNGNSSSITYTVPNKVVDHVDLVWTNSAVQNLTKQTIDGKVVFVFQHALSKIDFTIEAATDEVEPGNIALDKNTKIEVKNVTLKGNFTKTATLNLSNTGSSAAWSAHTGAQNYELTSSNFNVYVLTSENSATAQPLNNEKSHLMIIPQNLTFDVYIEYDVITTGKNAAGEDDNSTITNKITKSVENFSFESGKQYKLNLVLGMTSVKLNASVADWVTAEATQVDLPLNQK